MTTRRTALKMTGLAAAAVAAPTIVRAQRTKTLRMGHIFPETHPYHAGLVRFAEELQRRTNGSVEVLIYSSGQLGGEVQIIEGMSLGTVDGGIVTAGTLAQTHGIRQYYLLDMPYIFRDYDAIERFVDSEIAHDIRSFVQPAMGIRILGLGGNGFSQMINRQRPVYVPDDLNGLRFRVWESPSARLSYEVMNMSPTPMPYAEVFTAIQQGVVDGLVNSMTTLYLTQMHEVARYLSLSDQLYAFLFMMISEQAYRSLDSDEQEAAMVAAEEACRHWRGIYPVNDQEYRHRLADAGCEVNEVDKDLFREYVRSRYDRYLEIVDAPGAEDLMNRLIEFGAS